MNKITERMLKGKAIVPERLEPFGFVQRGGEYVYRVPICAGEFFLTVTVDAKGGLDTAVTDAETGDLYTLYLVEEAEGSFVGSVREACEDTLAAIAASCCETEAFHEETAKRLIAYVRERYGRALEFLWEDTPDCAVWRRADNRKWFGAIMCVSRKKLGLNEEGSVEILDFRMTPEELDVLADGKRYFRGYHMNKRHWATVCLDGAVEAEEVFRRIDESYRLAKK